MKILYLSSAIVLFLLSGCAGQTTDPRKGGLFSYDPDAYEQRLADRRNYLASIEKDTEAQKRKQARLKRELAAQKRKQH